MVKSLIVSSGLFILWMGFEAPPTAQAVMPDQALLTPMFPEQVQVDYYKVRGSNIDALARSIEMHRPHDRDVLIDWDIGWGWPKYGRTDCQLEQAKIRSRINISFPKWEPVRKPNAALLSHWNGYTQRISSYNLKHINTILAGVIRMEHAVKASTCETAEPTLISIANEVRQQIDERDSNTDYGKLLGATLIPAPPPPILLNIPHAPLPPILISVSDY